MKQTLIHQAKIINEGKSFTGSVLIKDNLIEKIFKEEVPEKIILESQVIDAQGKWLIPGVIDEHVHFREPGLTDKADIYTESRAAAAGGVTSFMDMPNTVPQTTTLELVEEKCRIAAEKSLINYSFYLGATNTNIDEIKNANPKKICGLKLFMGASTGNMLVDERAKLEEIFKTSPLLIAAHCEVSSIISANAEKIKQQFDEQPIPIKYHAEIRSEDACYQSTSLAVELAKKHNARLHVLHVSTAKELALFNNVSLRDKKITAETCPQYLLFDSEDYETLGAKIKCNPAIKAKTNKEALLKSLADNTIDCIATDHAPHLLADKTGDALTAVSGIPLIQYSLAAMLELVKKGYLTREKLVEKMCHNPAILYNVSKRGFIRKGYFADLVLINPNKIWTVGKDNILSKCGWSLFEGRQFNAQVTHTFVNGVLVFDNGKLNEDTRGERLTFERN
ncbi:MAG: dihydroorotase [Prevotellaceae bacterium]|nr:dihydroorotase [Prevotellaceae bacterium]